MPSPLAHPAASIPFTKIGMVFSALVIGSIAPDLWYVIKVGPAFFSYTITGLFVFDLPVGFIMLWLFQALVKWPLLSLLPVGLQRRLYNYAHGFSFRPLKRFGLVILSLLVGSLTHIIWDSFTHDYGWMVENFSFLRAVIGRTPLYDILQTLSTLVGIAILVYWFFRWLPTAPKGDRLASRFSGKVVAIFLALTAVTLAVVEGLILYSRYLSVSPAIHRHMWLGGSLRISAVFIIVFYIGVYCLTWTIAFHKSIQRVR